ncbi:MAG: glycosyltransferase [Leptolyngbyaceae cyanobacterium CSU_1_3]|nr:glycosyltransferase [Leptolyngbyaceae cyanobacterium CSU_1_3]
MRKWLLVFTRYPEPGTTKTRLIPALGAEGAADLHRRMAEQTVTEAKKLPEVAIEVQFAGGDPARMQRWLGDELRYQPQSLGDLGDRLSEAFRLAFDREANAVIAIGTDCPDVDANLLLTAFDQLKTYDLVIGSATDGGYYLIGCRCFVPDLFVDITWSTSVVFRQTIAIAEHLGLSIAFLPTLSDIDRPEDLGDLQ